MNLCINRGRAWLNRHPKLQQWLWFIGLWFAGLFTVMALAYPIKLAIRAIE
jgi:hypothetical protein